MAVMVGVVGALSAFHHDAADFSDAERRKLSFQRIVARMPTIVAMAYKYSIGEPFMSPRSDLSYTANFLYMMFGTPRETYRPNPLLVRALDRLFIMHAEMGRMLQPRRYEWPVPRAQTRLPALPRRLPACQALRMQGPARRAWRCSKRSATSHGLLSSSPAPAMTRQSPAVGFGHPSLHQLRPKDQAMRACATIAAGTGAGESAVCSRWRKPSRKLRSKIPISSRTNSTQMWTSTRPSCKRRSVYRLRCSPASSHWLERRDGWRSGRKCWVIPNTRSRVRVSSTLGVNRRNLSLPA
jgi:hypothetical protein